MWFFAVFFPILRGKQINGMKTTQLFKGLYILAFGLIVLYLLREVMDIPPDLSPWLYYVAIGIFGIGLIRIVYLIVGRK
jgi:hypothetical protein